MMKKIKLLPYLFAGVLLISLSYSCDNMQNREENPFDTNMSNQDSVNFVLEEIDPNTIAGLYQNIFNPTCANSGCHDGTFEPDFRTIESSYHSLLFQVPVKNNGTQTFRVDPGNPNQSAIMQRLSGAILPLMPIEVDPDSDWDVNGDEYIANVRTWIENGALDLSGNEPQADFINPSLFGAVAFSQGELLPRENGFGKLLIPSTANMVEFYFAFDTINIAQDFTVNELVFGIDDNDNFQESTTVNLTILDEPLKQFGLHGTLVDFTHKVEINLNSSMLDDDSYHMRVKVKDGSYPITEIPTNDGIYFIKEYMSFLRTN